MMINNSIGLKYFFCFNFTIWYKQIKSALNSKNQNQLNLNKKNLYNLYIPVVIEEPEGFVPPGEKHKRDHP